MHLYFAGFMGSMSDAQVEMLLKDLDVRLKELEPKLKMIAACTKRNHHDAQGRQYPQQLILDRGGTGKDLLYCTNCEMPHAENPPYEKVRAFYRSLRERMMI